ncbi:MAG: YggS family pyridoxal phosphate-dependent enzyme [Armatimonadetes bacterium]|nr:YggS family pyridoxal phosphate-dependent enzyme [Armatimonadota bacterium]
MQIAQAPSVIATNYDRMMGRIQAACQRQGKKFSDVTVVAVTKTVEVARVREVIASGASELGENYVQEARPKAQAVGKDRVRWHFIGHLQKNKVNSCLDFFELIHSVDGFDLARRIAARAGQQGRKFPILLELNLSGETTKFGVRPPDLIPLMESIETLEHIEVAGLMTIPPPRDDAEDSRPFFKRLRSLADDLDRRGYRNWNRKYLSMGMTDDFEVALQEGSNLLRVGRGIFGGRG